MSALATSLINGQSLENVPGLLKRIIAGDMWQERVVQQTKRVVKFRTFREFVEEYPPEGLHTKLDLLMKICQSYEDMEAVDMLAKVSAGRNGGDRRSDAFSFDNVQTENVAPTGNSTAATMRRLAKDFPAIHAKVIAKELSPHAAAIEAGFRKRPMQMPADPEAAGRYLAQRVDREWFAVLIDEFYKAQG